MVNLSARLWKRTDGQGIAEYAMMMAVVLAIVIGTLRMIGVNAGDIFSHVASTIQSSDSN